jgi:hypothetical protein
MKGVDPQDTINKQIKNDYDIFIGIMWSKVGTKTARAESGTIEEFERAFSRARDGQNVDAMFYFNSAPLAIDQINPVQIQKIQEFKERLGAEGVYYWNYVGVDRFEEFVRVHLNLKLKSISEKENSRDNKENEGVTNIDEEEDDIGILDILSDFTQSSFYLFTGMNSIQTTIHELIDDLSERTDELSKFQGNSMQKYSVALNKTTIVMNKFSQRFEVESKDFGHGLSESMKSFSRLIEISNEYNINIPQMDQIANQVREIHSKLIEFKVAINQASSTLDTIPPLQKNFNKSLKSVKGHFINMSRDVMTTIATIESMEKLI